MIPALARSAAGGALLLVMALPDAACHSSPSASVGADPSGLPSAFSAVPVDKTPPATAPADAETADALKVLADGNNAFGLDVYARARRGGANLALSPLSLSVALTMTWAGARGETAAQMKAVLHTPDSPETALGAEARLLAWVRDPAQTVTLRVANRLFGEQSYSFAPAYVDRTRTAFGAPLDPVDFTNAPDASRRHINAWVAGETDQQIRDLIPPGGVPSDTRLVLANAIYFLGRWEHPFPVEATKPARFHMAPARAKDVPMMHESERLLFAHVDGVKVLQVPYTGGQLAMAFVLPDQIDGLDAVEPRLSPAALTAWLGALQPARVKVALPKYETAPSQPLALRGILASLGMPLAFDPSKADFTGIADPPRPEERLFIGDVFHEAFVKVDEHGTEAAAATGITMRPTLIVREPRAEFTADHPFLFFLRDVGSGLILFMGRVGDPSDPHRP